VIIIRLILTLYSNHKTSTDLVKQIDLCVGIAGITRMPEQQLNETDKCIKGMEALDSDSRHHLARLGQRSVAQIDTHLSAETEETCYEVISLEDALKMHLSYNKIHKCSH